MVKEESRKAPRPEKIDALRARAEIGHADSQCKLGSLYRAGLVVPQDDAEAVRWYRLAVEQGDADAMINLGVRYAQGQGVPQDYAQAHMWRNLSASRLTGEERKISADGRDLLAESMTPEQIVEAQRLAREWDAAHPREP